MKPHYSLAVALLALPSIATSAPDINGRIMLDYSFFDGVHNNHAKGSEWEIRRARIGLKHKHNENWEAELEVNIDNENESVSVTDGYLQYKGWNFADITFGKMKEAFGLENTTSSMDISTMERSVVTEVFKPGRNFGVELANDSKISSWNLGVFHTGEDQYGLDTFALTGRLTYSPINNPISVTHLGVSASSRDMQGSTHEVNEPLEVNTAGKIVESREVAVDTINQMSLEGAWVYKRFSIQGEWIRQDIEESALVEQRGGRVEFSGHYILLSYFVTGESRVYDGGSFGEVKPASARGAWELVSRYSSIDLMDMQQGTRANTALIGLNYYATSRVRLMLNVARAEVESSDPTESGNGNSVAFRAQYEF